MTAAPASSPLPPEANLQAASRRGAPLVIAGHLASQLIGLATLVVLNRLLRPEDYGLLGVVLPAVMLPRMAATLGPGIAVMQRNSISRRFGDFVNEVNVGWFSFQEKGADARHIKLLVQDQVLIQFAVHYLFF